MQSLRGKIKLAQKQLGLDDDTYRDMLQRVTGLRSTKGMTAAQMQAVIADCIRRGFKPAPGKREWKGKPKQTGDVPMLRKIEALLADAGREWAYATGTARHMFGIERLEWLNDMQLHKLVAALQKDANRRSKR